MNQIQFISEIKKLNIAKLCRIGSYFVQINIINTNFYYERSHKSEWRKKECISGKEVYSSVTVCEVLESLDEDYKKILINSLHIFLEKQE